MISTAAVSCVTPLAPGGCLADQVVDERLERGAAVAFEDPPAASQHPQLHEAAGVVLEGVLAIGIGAVHQLVDRPGWILAEVRGAVHPYRAPAA